MVMYAGCTLVVEVVGSVGALFMRRLGEAIHTGRLPRGLKPAALWVGCGGKTGRAVPEQA